MADQYAVNHKKRHVTVPAKLTDVADQGGRMRVMYDKFTFTSPNLAMAVGDTISFGKLPPGAKVLEAVLHQSATLGTNCDLSLGYTGATTAFLGADDAVAAGTRYMKGASATASPVPVTITSEVSVIASVAVAVTSTTAAFVEVKIYYTVD